jgi:hypothetical protein
MKIVVAVKYTAVPSGVTPGQAEYEPAVSGSATRADALAGGATAGGRGSMTSVFAARSRT